MKRIWGIALLISTAFVTPVSAKAKHPAKCRAGYVRKTVKVPKRNHGRIVHSHGKTVYVRVQKCVRIVKPKHPKRPTRPSRRRPAQTPLHSHAPTNTTPPLVSGGGHAGQTMSGTPGAWSGMQPMSLAYQWQRCNTSGGGCQKLIGATSTTYVVQDADVGSTLELAVTASNGGGSRTAASAATGPMQYLVVVAVGDIACPATDTTDPCQQKATARLAAAQNPNAIVMLGDSQYMAGLTSEYYSAGAYNDTWGMFNPIVYPMPGNHEYGLPGDIPPPSASGYFSYFGAAANPMHTPNGYYSFNLGSWHVDALNSNCYDSGCADTVNGGTTSAQTSWLQHDLSSSPSACTLAFWHHPFISAGEIGNNPYTNPLFGALYGAHADIVLGGHDHLYERYPQLDASGNADSTGIREFVVGTGGESLVSYYPNHVAPTPPTYDDSEFGVLVLTLHTNSYDWAFKNANGAVRDSGTTSCHGSSSSAPRAARNSAPNPRLFAPQLAFDARPARSSLKALARPGIPVAIHCSRGCDVTVHASLRLGGRIREISTFYETESEITQPNSVVLLRSPARRLKGVRHATLVLRFDAIDAARHRRSLTRTVAVR